MNSQYVLGVDIGTTSTKSVLFSRDGKVLASHGMEYTMMTPTAAVAELNPDELFQAVIQTIRHVMIHSKADPGRVLCVSFSSAMHSVIAVDAKGHPLTNVITWADNRSAVWADKIKNEMNGHEIYRRTGTPIHPMSPLVKLVWLRNECPELFLKASKFISIKEYVFLKLFNEYIVDYSIASATGLFNLHSLNWDPEALQVAGVTPDHLSAPVNTTFFQKGMDPVWANEMGLLAETPFVVGASDGVLSNLGVNAVNKGDVAITIGTSGAIRTIADKPITDPLGRIFCYALTDKDWVIGGPVNNGGMILRWVRDQLGAAEKETAMRLGIDPYGILADIAAQVRPGSDGLIFLPYLAGERAPLWDANARGCFFGLSMHHKKEHMIRAAMEGVIFNLYTVFLVLEELMGSPKKIHATGGFARSRLWCQILADTFHQEVCVPESVESSCLGAAVLGLYGIGEADSLTVVKDMVGVSYQHTPNAENVDVYQELGRIYMRVIRALKDEFAGIAAFQSKMVQ